MPYKSVLDILDDRYHKAADVCNLPYVPFVERRAALRTLRAAEGRIHALQERECNGYGWGPGQWIGTYPNAFYERTWTDADDAKAERLTEAAYKRAEGAAAVLGGRLVRGSGDPRGNALAVEFSRPGNPAYPYTLYFGD